MERKKMLLQLAELITCIRLNHPVRVGINGVDASGKTTLAGELADILKTGERQVIRGSIDGFHNPKKWRYRRGRDSAEGYYLDSFNIEALTDGLLKPLGPNGSLQYRESAFDFMTDSETRCEIKKADPDSILLFEGVFLFGRSLVAYWDYKIFIEADFDVTLKRAVGRDGYYLGGEEDVIKKYQTRYIPGQKLYLEQAKPKQRADVIVHNNDFDNPELRFDGGSF